MDVKFCVADPSGTVTAVGSCVDVRVSLNDTDVPPGWASPESVTVPVTVLQVELDALVGRKYISGPSL